MEKNLTYLALGDSYTVGEAVPLQKNFPYQVVQLLRKKGVSILAPEIVAKTGWTTDELEKAMMEYTFLSSYDFVSLLIGVNNQYRGRPLREYEEDLERLLQRAVQLAGHDPHHVFLISIPDYAVTPTGQSMNPVKISEEIDDFNSAASQISKRHSVPYIYITEGSRDAKWDPALVAQDGLHPSEKEYAKWAASVAEAMISGL